MAGDVTHEKTDIDLLNSLATQLTFQDPSVCTQFMNVDGKLYLKVHKNISSQGDFLDFCPDEFLIATKCDGNGLKMEVRLYSYNENLVDSRNFSLTAKSGEKKMLEYSGQLLNSLHSSCQGLDDQVLKHYNKIEQVLIENYKGKIIYRSRNCLRSTNFIKTEDRNQGNLCSNCLNLLANIPYVVKKEANLSQDSDILLDVVEKVELIYEEDTMTQSAFFDVSNQNMSNKSRPKRLKKIKTKQEIGYDSDGNDNVSDIIDDSDNDANFVAENIDESDSDDNLINGVDDDKQIKKEAREMNNLKLENEANFLQDKKAYSGKKKRWTKLELQEKLKEGNLKFFDCSKCKKRFYNRKSLENHNKQNHADVRCPKPGCDKVFMEYLDKGMKSHLTQNHKSDDDLQLKCPNCDEKYSSLTEFLKHESTHKTKKIVEPFKVAKTCEMCGKSFTSKKKWNNHQKVHEIHKCEDCNKSFHSKGTYKEHLSAVHLTDSKYVCSVCGKAYRWRNGRLLCEKSHKGEYYYSCPVCGKQFQMKFKLENHYVVHTGEKPWHCPICPFKCNRRDNLNLHTKKVHKTSLTDAEQATGKSAKAEVTQLSLLPRSEIKPSNCPTKIKAESSDTSLPTPPPMKAAPMLTPAQMAAAVRIPTAAQQLTSEISADPTTRTLTAEEIVKMDDQDIAQFVNGF